MRNLWSTISYDPRFFAGWRIALGAYLSLYFVALIPYAGNLYASGGVLPPAAENPLYAYAPFAALPLSSLAAQAILAVLAALSLLFLIGRWRIGAAVLLWIGMTFLFIRNPLTEDPSMAFINLALLLSALVPRGEGWSLGRKKAVSNWYMPRMVYVGAWATLAIAYSASGIDRLLAPSWQDGTALHHLFTLSTVFDNPLTHFFQSLPQAATAFLTYIVSLAFLLAVPLALSHRVRPYAWLLYMLMFALIGLVINLTQVILGILLYQLFLFDSAWVRTGPFARPYRFVQHIWARL